MNWSVGALVAIAALMTVGCKKPAPPTVTDAAVVAPPVDHLERGEIAEGNEKAFALLLPRQARVVYRLNDAIEVESDHKPEALVNFVRSRAKTAKVVAGAGTTTFEEVFLPEEPKRQLQIEIRPAPRGRDARSTMMVRDVTPLPPVPKVSEEDAWRAVGRTPDGKPLDPKHMF